jgi:hypothetical protein
LPLLGCGIECVCGQFSSISELQLSKLDRSVDFVCFVLHASIMSTLQTSYLQDYLGSSRST